MAISKALKTATKLRFPVFGRDVGPRQRISQLEEHIEVTAYWQGELEQERLEAYECLRELQYQWDALEGWQAMKRSKTEAAVDDAKRQVRPDLHRELMDTRWQVKRLGEQIDRLEREAQKASRAYTLVTGS